VSCGEIAANFARFAATTAACGTKLLTTEGNAMLVLSRKTGEKIVISDSITITVVRLAGDRVQIGIEAPREMPVHRQEVRDRMQSEVVLSTARLPRRSFRWTQQDLVAAR
jgi:carbon storage regulator